jgi:DNA-binding response OmpR family regulator
MNKEINSKKAAILIVEDEVESQKFFELILRKKFEMDFCASRKTMNTLLKEKIYDAVIMDISLKDGNNGFDLIKEIRRSSTRTEIPIVCLSAHMYDEDKHKAKQAGADVYLTKPVKGQLLVSTLEDLLVADTKKEK